MSVHFHSDRKVYIAELARAINRRENTVRGWQRSGKLPKRLHPKRDSTTTGGAGWRYWTPEQVEEIRHWMASEKMTPGSGLKNYSPDPDEVDNLLMRLRSRKTQPDDEEAA